MTISRSGGGGRLAYSKNYPFCVYLDLKSIDHKTVVSQSHFSGDPKSYAQKNSYPKKYSPFRTFFLNLTKNRPSLCIYKKYHPWHIPPLWVFSCRSRLVWNYFGYMFSISEKFSWLKLLVKVSCLWKCQTVSPGFKGIEKPKIGRFHYTSMDYFIQCIFLNSFITDG